MAMVLKGYEKTYCIGTNSVHPICINLLFSKVMVELLATFGAAAKAPVYFNVSAPLSNVSPCQAKAPCKTYDEK